MATGGNAASVTTATCTSHDPVKPTAITINAQIRRLAVTDIYRNLPLEERIGALRDGDSTNQGVPVDSRRLKVQPQRKPIMSDDIVTRLQTILDPEMPLSERSVISDAIEEIKSLKEELILARKVIESWKTLKRKH